jgi:monofunctional biosynthetic peptidoglycan transglycosylase
MPGIVLNSTTMTSVRPATTAAARAPRSLFVRLLRAVVLLLAFILLLPYLIAPLYHLFNPVSTLMLWRWMKGARIERTVVPLDRIAPILPRTVIASEDARFCSHWGIDWQELQQAIDDAEDLSEVRGGSTISQQLAKNLFLWPGRSFVRKALEFPLALWIDLVLGKRRVLEIYLNVAEWGPSNQFGVEAGARRAFNKSARDLNAGEAALLAAVLPNPIRRSARQPGPAVRRIAARVQARAAAAPSVDACVRVRRTP